MQNESWSSVQIERPDFVSRKGVTAVAIGLLSSVGLLMVIGAAGPIVFVKHHLREDHFKPVGGTTLTIDPKTETASWNVRLKRMYPDRQFMNVNARIQRPGFTDKSIYKGVKLEFRQDYTMTSWGGTGLHHFPISTNHSHHHHVTCLSKKRFCEPFVIFNQDYLLYSSFMLDVEFAKPGIVGRYFRPPAPSPAPTSQHHHQKACDKMKQDGKSSWVQNNCPKTWPTRRSLTIADTTDMIKSQVQSQVRRLWGMAQHSVVDAFDESFDEFDETAHLSEEELQDFNEEDVIYAKVKDNTSPADSTGSKIQRKEEEDPASVLDFHSTYPEEQERELLNAGWGHGEERSLDPGEEGGTASSSTLAPSSHPTLAPTMFIERDLSYSYTPAPTPLSRGYDTNTTFALLLEITYVNRHYTNFEIGVKYVFLLCTLGVSYLYVKQLWKLSSQMWGYQQKWILVLLAWLVWFDEPLIYFRIWAVDDNNVHKVSHMNEGRHSAATFTRFATFCNTSFVAVLMIYFLCVLEEMGSGRLWQKMQMPTWKQRLCSDGFKVGLVGTQWALTFATYLYIRHQQDLDPSFSMFGDADSLGNERHPGYDTIGALVILCTVIYLLWFLVLLIDAVRAIKNLSPPFLFIFCVTIGALLTTVAGTFSGAYYSVPDSSFEFISFFGILNLFVYTLAFSYMPLPEMVATHEEDGMLEMADTPEGYGDVGSSPMHALDDDEDDE